MMIFFFHMRLMTLLVSITSHHNALSILSSHDFLLYLPILIFFALNSFFLLTIQLEIYPFYAHKYRHFLRSELSTFYGRKYRHFLCRKYRHFLCRKYRHFLLSALSTFYGRKYRHFLYRKYRHFLCWKSVLSMLAEYRHFLRSEIGTFSIGNIGTFYVGNRYLCLQNIGTFYGPKLAPTPSQI